MSTTIDMRVAADFVWRTARLLDRRRFEYLFDDGVPEGVLAALRAYQNPDGGFGHALEPDLRAPVSQPAAVWTALRVLDEIDAFTDPIVGQACNYLETITGPDGGVPFVLPSADPYPRAPWWQIQEDPSGNAVQTAWIVALLHKRGVEHPWVEGATEFCWKVAEALEETNPYEMRFLLPFLQYAPDRARAEAAFARVGPKIFEQNLVELDPGAPGEIHTPLDYAPTPDSIARQLFTDDVIDDHLDALANAQQRDGGWMFNWQDWNPATTQEWRGAVTIDALVTLRAYGRLP